MIHQIVSHPQQIAAILPQYRENGDTTLILSMDGEKFVVTVQVRTFIQQLARRQAIDLGALRSNAREVTHSQLLQPLAFCPAVLLCPMKVRQAKIKGDNCTGYINACAVESFEQAVTNEEKPHCKVHLYNGMTLTVFLSARAIENQLRNARLAEAHAPYQTLFQNFNTLDLYSDHTRNILISIESLTHGLLNLLTINDNQTPTTQKAYPVKKKKDRLPLFTPRSGPSKKS
ncbi:MAG: hypothetical protein H6Q65_110 [Firmicutes bacterium]|nr:hypothetical protein [Bacillota bacterium]